MMAMGVLLVIGVVITVSWSGIAYRQWEPGSDDRSARLETDNAPASVRITVLRYLRGVAIALVGGFWAGALVTGPAVRLIMRLLAVTAGDDAEGRMIEADKIVGRIELDGTIGLYIFGWCPPRTVERGDLRGDSMVAPDRAIGAVRFPVRCTS